MTQVLRGSVVAVLGVIVALLPATASAQGVSQDRVATAIGKNVIVTSKDGTKQRGALRTLSATEVVLDQSTVPLANVSQIERTTHALRNGVIIGLAAGLGTGLVVVAGGGGDEAYFGSEGAAYIMMFAGIGASAGAGIGAALRAFGASRMVYQAQKKTNVSVSPTIGKRKLGVAGTIRW